MYNSNPIIFWVAIQYPVVSYTKIYWDATILRLWSVKIITLTFVHCWVAWRKSGNFITTLGNETKSTFASKFKSHLTFHNSMSTTIIKWSCNKTSSILIYLLPFSARAWNTNLEKCFYHFSVYVFSVILQPIDTYRIVRYSYFNTYARYLYTFESFAW